MHRLLYLSPLFLLFLAFGTAFATETGSGRAIERVRHHLAAGEPGVRQEGGSIVLERLVSLRRKQEVDFFAVAQGGQVSVRLRDPEGKLVFAQAPGIPEDTNAAEQRFGYGFHYEAPKRGRYRVELVAPSGSDLHVYTSGHRGEVPTPELPGSWVPDYESLAFEILNAQGAPMEQLAAVTAKLERQVQIELVFRADGTWSAIMATNGNAKRNGGTWSRSGDAITIVTKTENRQPMPREDWITEHLTLVEDQLVMGSSETGLPFAVALDKVN